MARYLATFIPQQQNSWLGRDFYPAKPQGETQWDCTDYLIKNYTETEIHEIVDNGIGDEMTDSVRADPNAPQWIRDWDDAFEVRVTEMVDNTKYDGIQCPKCQSIMIDGDGILPLGEDASQIVTCRNCDSQWREHYTLTGYEILSTPD